MKLIGMGIVDGIDGIPSYLETVQILADGSPPPMSILRWWFSMQYEPVGVTPARDFYSLRGQGVQVLSENEILAAQGKRIHTRPSDELNKQFADSFTAHFEEIAKRYPIYEELRNLFDIALILSLVEQEGLREQVGWHGTWFADRNALGLPRMDIPTTVETVVNHRILNRKYLVAGISGGVWIDGLHHSQQLEKIENTKNTVQPQITVPTQNAEQELWWWN